MNRFTGVLYPSIPGPTTGTGSEGSSAVVTPMPHDRRPISPSLTPIDAHFPPVKSSIYDDPRATTFPPPEEEPHHISYAAVANSSSRRTSAQADSANDSGGPGTASATGLALNTGSAAGSGSGAASGAVSGPGSGAPSGTASAAVSAPGSVIGRRPSGLLRLTDEALRASAARRSASPSPSPSRRGRDRGLRVNLMQAASKAAKGRGAPPAAGGRLSSMAQGPGGRFVVGGGQYLRVHEIQNPAEGNRTPDGTRTPTGTGSGHKSPRHANAPFARGIGGSTISEVVNFWKGSWAIGKGVNDVDWGTANFDTKIVTATPSGNFMIFDINRAKLERETSGGHTRPMNCIKFSKVQNSAYLLITGGTEGQVRLWDMRDSEPTNRKFYKHNAPVTALTFSPDDPHLFVVGTEAGGLFRYDYRVMNKTVGKVWGAHGSKPVMDLKWKLPAEDSGAGMTGRGWLASAGGDRTVQIWDMSQAWDKIATPTHTLHTAHPVRCVDWRPNHPTELVVVPFNILTSAAPDPTRPEQIPDESDSSLEVWDVRRHHVAKYALPGSDGNAVAAIWDDADTLVACYEGGGLVQRDLNSRIVPKTLPLEHIQRQVTAWSAKGELAYALDKFRPGEIPFDDIKPEFASWQVGGHKSRKCVGDQPYEPHQSLGVLALPDNDESEFVYMAQQYHLEADPPMALCRWNREVAEVCGRVDEARIWDHLQGLIEEFGAVGEGLFNESVFSQSAAATGGPVVRTTSPRAMEEQSTTPTTPSPPGAPAAMSVLLERITSIVESDPESDAESDASSRSSHSTSQSSAGPQTPKRSRFKSFLPPSVSHPPAIRPQLISRGASSMTIMPRVLGRTKRLQVLETPKTEHTSTPTPLDDIDYPDPYGIAAALESIAPPGMRGGLTSRSTPHSTRPPTPATNTRGVGSGSGPASPIASQRPSIAAGAGSTSLEAKRIQPAAIARRAQEAFAVDEWDVYRSARCRVFLDWWKTYVDDGEVQVAATLYVVGKDVVNFPKAQVERVVDAYIDLLERHRLNIPVAYLRRYADILSLQTLPGQDGITHILYCSHCGKSTGALDDVPGKKQFWWCRKCRRGAKICTVCREPVKGLWMGCNQCRHGGHQNCMRLYYLATEKTEAEQLHAQAHSQSQGTSTSQSHSQGQHQSRDSGSRHTTESPPPPVRRHSVGPTPRAEASLDSGFTDRTERDTDPSAGISGIGSSNGHEVLVSTNQCPSGCGCRCMALKEARA